MKFRKSIAAAAFSLLVAFLGPFAVAQSAPAGDVDVATLIANAPEEAACPLDDVLLLHDHTTITLHEDGRVERRHRRVMKILNEYGIDNHCDPRIGWNSETQELVVHGLRTHMCDGTVVERTTGMGPDHNLSRVTPDTLDHFPDFIRHQETVVTFLGIELGCVVDFDYSIVDRVSPAEGSGRQWKGISDVHLMQDGITALERIFTIRAPASARLRLAPLNGAPGPVEENVGAMKVVSWTMKDVAGARMETDCAGAADFLPAVAYDVWIGPEDDRYGWYRDWKASFDAAADRAGTLPGKVEELCKGLSCVDDKFKALHSFARKSVRPVAFEPLLLDVPPRPVERVYESAYASGKEHAALLLALCRAADINCWPVLVSDCNVQGDLCVQGAVTGVYLAAVLEQGQFFFDPAKPLDTDLAMTTPASRVLTPVKKGRPLSTYPCRVRVTGEVAVGKDLSVTADVTVRHTGPGNPFMKLSAFGEGKRDGFLGALAGRILPGGKTTVHNILDLTRLQSSFSLDVKAPSLKKEPNGTVRLPMLAPDALVGTILPAAFKRPPAKREGPVRIEFPVNLSIGVTVTVPDTLEVVRLPETVEIADQLGSYVVRWSEEDGTITLECALDLGKSVVGPDRYDALRRLMTEVADTHSLLLLFRPSGGKS